MGASGSFLSIDLETNQVQNWLFDSGITINYKTSDCCILKFEHRDYPTLFRYEGYVPDFFLTIIMEIM
jgi:hypothetical protein